MKRFFIIPALALLTSAICIPQPQSPPLQPIQKYSDTVVQNIRTDSRLNKAVELNTCLRELQQKTK